MKTLRTIVLAFAMGMATLACAHAGSPGGPSIDPPVLPSERVNLNTATENDLVGVKGIGPVKADHIIKYRKSHGDFARIEDLTRVKGFGRKSVAKLRMSLTVEPSLTKEAPAAKR